MTTVRAKLPHSPQELLAELKAATLEVTPDVITARISAHLKARLVDLLTALQPDASATKTCIVCGATKPIDAFYRTRRDSEARQSRCKPCDNRGRARSASGGMSDTVVDAIRRPDGSIEMVRRPRRGL